MVYSWFLIRAIQKNRKETTKSTNVSSFVSRHEGVRAFVGSNAARFHVDGYNNAERGTTSAPHVICEIVDPVDRIGARLQFG